MQKYGCLIVENIIPLMLQTELAEHWTSGVESNQLMARIGHSRVCNCMLSMFLFRCMLHIVFFVILFCLLYSMNV